MFLLAKEASAFLTPSGYDTCKSSLAEENKDLCWYKTSEAENIFTASWSRACLHKAPDLAARAHL